MRLTLHRAGYGFLLGSFPVSLRRFSGRWRIEPFDATNLLIVEWLSRNNLTGKSFLTRREAYLCACLAVSLDPPCVEPEPAYCRYLSSGLWQISCGLVARRAVRGWQVLENDQVVGRASTLWMAARLAADGRMRFGRPACRFG